MPDPQLFLPITFTLAAIGLAAWNGRRDVVSPLITIPWVIHLILWGALPFILQPFLSEGLATSAGPLSRNGLATLQSATMLVLVLAHLAIERPLVQPITGFFDRYAPLGRNLFVPTLIAVIALFAVEVRTSQVTGGTFAEWVSAAVTADAQQLAESGLLSSLLGILVGFCVAIISMGKREGITKATLGLAWTGMLIFSAFSIARGSRAAVLVPAAAGLVAISTLRGRARKRAIGVVLTLGVLTVVIGAPVAAVMGVVRAAPTSVDLGVLRDAYTTILGGSTVGTQVELIASEVNRKFDAIGPGVELLAMEPPGFAGLTPILSASVSPIPRILFPGKPVPTSRDGTYLGTPYRIAAKAYGDPEIGMVMPVSASAIALWEFGWLGPLALVLANLLSLGLLNAVLISSNVYVRAVGISVLGLPNCEFFIGHPSGLVQNGLRLCLYLVLMAMACLVYKEAAQSMRLRRRNTIPLMQSNSGSA